MHKLNKPEVLAILIFQSYNVKEREPIVNSELLVQNRSKTRFVVALHEVVPVDRGGLVHDFFPLRVFSLRPGEKVD